MGLFDRMKQVVKPVARKVVFGTAVHPTGVARLVYRALFDADYVARETYEWARRAFVATPTFLARCAVHGTEISCDRLPYITGPVRIELGSKIRISGKIGIKGASQGAAAKEPTLRIGSGVFIGHGTQLAVARSIEIGDFVSIGGACYIADTDGHTNYAPGRPIWEVPASAEDIAPVVIEDNVQISRDVTILKGVRIGARAIIGAGAVVRSDIPADAVVAGNPARVVKKMTGGGGSADKAA
jgi:acetyltransferase-like isoleucine patch superfamily enzyme